MKSFSFTEFRKRASEILTLVERGETDRVVRHGKTVAKIIPAETEEKSPSWKRLGLRLVRPGASLTKAILDEKPKSRRTLSSTRQPWLIGRRIRQPLEIKLLEMCAAFASH